MTDPRGELQAIRALASAARAVARGTTSARIVLAHAHAQLDAGMLPPAIRDAIVPELESAAASIEPLPFADVEKALRAAWGTAPSGELDDLEREPAVVAPATQTHLGVRDGERIAVTVLRPGLAELVRSDLALADRLVAPARGAFPSIDVPAVVREARGRVLDDLDLEHVASGQRSLHRALRRHDDLAVARPHTDLSHAGVLVREHPDGTPVLELADATSRARAATLLVRFQAGAVRHGTIVADLRPDSVLLAPDGRLVVLDASGAAPVPAGRADLVADLLDAIAAADDDAGARVLVALGALDADGAGRAAALGRTLLGELAGGGPVRVDPDAARSVLESAEPHRDPLLALAPRVTLVPADLWPLRALAQTVALVIRLGAEVDWLAAGRAAARDGW